MIIEWITKSLGIDEMKSRLKLENKFNQVKHSSYQNGRAFYSCLYFFKETFHAMKMGGVCSFHYHVMEMV
jgi:hypothetical protein